MVPCKMPGASFHTQGADCKAERCPVGQLVEQEPTVAVG